MDGKRACKDNVFMERFWRTLKYEEVYLRAQRTVCDAQHHLERYMTFYNSRRPHSALDERMPDAVYFQSMSMAA